MKLFSENVSWHKANLHTHTTESDGKRTPEEAIGLYKAAGYDILALTDHRKSGFGYEHDDFIVLRSIECNVSPYLSEGNEETFHILGLNVPEGFIQTEEVGGTDPNTVAKRIKDCGGFTVLAHPAWSLNTADHILNLKGIDAVEIFNTVSGFPYNPDRQDSSAILDTVFNYGTFWPLFASDDTHKYGAELCYAATMIQTDDFTAKGVLDAVKNGKSYATTGPRFIQVEIENGKIHVECSPCRGAVMITNHPWIKDACQPAFGDLQTQFDFEFCENTRFVRIMLIDDNGRKAWTNPVKLL